MPVDGGRLGQGIDEVHDHAVADVGADQRSGEPAIVRPGPYRLPGCHLDIGYASGQIDLDDVRIGVVVVGLGQLEAAIPIGWRHRAGFRRHGCPGRQ
jgi:hypothetical protein